MNVKIVGLIFLFLFAFLPSTLSAPSRSKFDLYLIGWIDPGKFQEISEMDPAIVRRIYLHSGGGKIRTALLIAEYIKIYKLDTYVGENNKCYSACTIIFQAGKNRIAHKTAKFMYHYAFNRAGDRHILNKKWTKIMFDSLVENGMFRAMIKRIKPGEDFYIGPEEAMKYGIVTRIED